MEEGGRRRGRGEAKGDDEEEGAMVTRVEEKHSTKTSTMIGNHERKQGPFYIATFLDKLIGLSWEIPVRGDSSQRREGT